jgi:HK97 family phage major capsid protein
MLSGGIATNIVTCASTTTVPNRHIQITEAELSEAISKLASNKLMGAKFYIHRNSLHYVRQLEDSGNSKIWMLPNAANMPATIYAYPYEIVESIPAAPNAGDSFIVFGNLKNYILGVRKGNWSLEVDPYGLFTTDMTRFRVVTRFDGEMGLENGLVAIETSGP